MARDPAHLEDSIRRAISAVDPAQAVTDIKTVVQLEADDMASDRLRSILLSAFAAVAAVLATLGLYGVMAYTVVQRTREIGIRAALGASTASLLGLVMRQGTAIVGWGLGAGLVMASWPLVFSKRSCLASGRPIRRRWLSLPAY